MDCHEGEMVFSFQATCPLVATYREYFMEATDFFGYGRQFLWDAESFRGVSVHIGMELCKLAEDCLKRARSGAKIAKDGGVESAIYLLRKIEEQEQKLKEIRG